MKLTILANERAFVLLDGVPSKYLAPGVHSVRALFKTITVERHNVNALVTELDEARAKLVPPGDLVTVSVGEAQRAVVYRRGVPVRWLDSGLRQVWTAERVLDPKTKVEVPQVSVEVLDVSMTTCQPLREDLKALAPAKDYVEVTVPEGAVAVKFVDGVLEQTLGPGRHAAFCAVQKVSFATVDLKERLLHVSGQDVLTRDRVSLRLNMSATFRVKDPSKLVTVSRNADDAVYLAVQLAARDAVTTRTLDELLAAREELVTAMVGAVAPRALAVGLELVDLGLKDVVLPGEMKALLNKVIEAQKEAEANVVLRREETAATRSMAQTAKVLAENPLLVRLKELEAYKELAGKVGQVHLVLGEGALSKLELKT